jgi:putative membrane protein
MISGYNDHAANERTFLAWIRTGIAVIAFGFLVEKFNLFLLTLAATGMSSDARRPQLAMLSGRIGRSDGLVLILGGVGLVVLATLRFVRTTRMLDDSLAHSASNVRTELILCAALVLVVTSYSVYLAFA